jgi:hypothetical protein
MAEARALATMQVEQQRVAQQWRREHDERDREHRPQWHNDMVHSLGSNVSHFAPTERQKKGKFSCCVADQMKEVVSGVFYKPIIRQVCNGNLWTIHIS